MSFFYPAHCLIFFLPFLLGLLSPSCHEHCWIRIQYTRSSPHHLSALQSFSLSETIRILVIIFDSSFPLLDNFVSVARTCGLIIRSIFPCRPCLDNWLALNLSKFWLFPISTISVLSTTNVREPPGYYFNTFWTNLVVFFSPHLLVSTPLFFCTSFDGYPSSPAYILVYAA